MYSVAIICAVMKLSSQELIEKWDELPPTNRRSPFSKQIVYKVLFHRNDQLAIKFIKKHDYQYG